LKHYIYTPSCYNTLITKDRRPTASHDHYQTSPLLVFGFLGNLELDTYTGIVPVLGIRYPVTYSFYIFRKFTSV